MDRFFDGPAGRLAYKAYGGDGARPVVLLPGLTCHAGYWDAVAGELSAGAPVYALDWRGHGASDHAPSYSFADYVADLDAFLAHVDAVDPVLVGHSLGGYVALLRATQPGISAVAALDVKTGSTEAELEGARKAAAKPQPRLAAREELAARLKAGMADGSAPDAVVATLAERGARENEDGTWSFRFDRAALAIEPVDPFAFAGRVQARTLVAHGANSALMDAAQARALADAVPGARCETVPDAGHHLMVDQPGAVAALVRGFLAAG